MDQSKFFSLCFNNFIHKKLITFNTVYSVFIDLRQWFFTSSIDFIYCSMLHGWSLASNSQFFNIYIWIRFRKAELSLVSLLEMKSCHWDPVPIIEMQPPTLEGDRCYLLWPATNPLLERENLILSVAKESWTRYFM